MSPLQSMKNSCYSPPFGKKDVEAKSQQGPPTNEWKKKKTSGPRVIYAHAFYCIPFTAKPRGAPRSFPHVLCAQYGAKILVSYYPLIPARIDISFCPGVPGHPTDKGTLFHHHQQELQCPCAPRTLQIEASPPTPLTVLSLSPR